jgi:hypothetical protein
MSQPSIVTRCRPPRHPEMNPALGSSSIRRMARLAAWNWMCRFFDQRINEESR